MADEYPEYPRWKYHAHERPVIVHDRHSEEALGEGWQDTPVKPQERTEEVSTPLGPDRSGTPGEPTAREPTAGERDMAGLGKINVDELPKRRRL